MKKKNGEAAQLKYDISREYIRKYGRVFLVLLALISVIELAMMVRSLILGDFTSWYRIAYFVSYAILCVASAGTFTAIHYNRRHKKIYRALYYLTQVYGSVIIIWAFIITSIDVFKGNTMIVFLTVIMCISFILRMNPVLFSALAVPLSAALVCLGKYHRSESVSTTGYIINFTVFILFAVLLAFIQDRLTKREYIAQRELERLSYCDQLTGVYNRYSLKKDLGEKSGGRLSYFGIIDTDDFKHINDSYGHNFGDSCLKTIAELLKNEFGDNVYRYGGDEFVVITGLGKNDISGAVIRINTELGKAFKSGEVHISAGFYCPSDENEEYKDRFMKADNALYRAKESGKSKAVFYEE